MGVMKDRVHRGAKCGIAGVTVMPRFLGHGRYAARRAVWANRLSIPADTLNVRDAIGFGREFLVD